MGSRNKERLLSDRLEPRYLAPGVYQHTLDRIRDCEADLLDLVDGDNLDRAEALLDDIGEHHRYLARIAKSKALLAQQHDARVEAEERVRALYALASSPSHVTGAAMNRLKKAVTKYAGLKPVHRQALTYAIAEVEEAFAVVVARSAATATQDHMRERIVAYVRDQAAVAQSATASQALFQVASEIEDLAPTPPPVDIPAHLLGPESAEASEEPLGE